MLIFLFHKLPHSSELCGDSRKGKSFNKHKRVQNQWQYRRRKWLLTAFIPEVSSFLWLREMWVQIPLFECCTLFHGASARPLLCLSALKNGKDGDTPHFWKAWKVLKSAFTGFLYMSYFYNVALWGVQSINSTALSISSHFKCQDQSSASQGLHWAADCIIKMLSGKQGPVFPSTP